MPFYRASFCPTFNAGGTVEPPRSGQLSKVHPATGRCIRFQGGILLTSTSMPMVGRILSAGWLRPRRKPTLASTAALLSLPSPQPGRFGDKHQSSILAAAILTDSTPSPCGPRQENTP